ncbi:hypothetical protein [Deinococcus aluminii]|uniref:hypothetical protein n=1 Tax=Deinococcus aluminii TaxID=1656885 RepID=UPI0031ED3B20
MPFTDEQRRLLLDNAYNDPRLPELLERMLIEGPGEYPMEPSSCEEEELPLWERVWSLVYHQATLYPATFVAVPFMCEVLKFSASTPEPFLYLAEIEAVRSVQQDVKNRFPAVTDELWRDYSEAIRSLGPLILEKLTANFDTAYRSEVVKASMLSLLAFSGGEERLGFALARWWPYAILGNQKIPLASVRQYEEMKHWNE